MTLNKPCLQCGSLTRDGSYCIEHTRKAPYRPISDAKRQHRQRLYGSGWRRLSERVRRLQPFCSICGSTQDLTAEHKAEAMARIDQGLPVRLQDCETLCRSPNSQRLHQRGA